MKPQIKTVLTFMALAWLCGAALADERAGAVYDPAADAEAAINATLAEAAQRDVPALLVFGANWCHDSRGFADRIATHPQLSDFMAEHYAVTFIDVGQRHVNLDQAARFGVETFHGTPTLVISNGDGLTENASTVHDWRAVYNAADADLATYFARFAGVAPVIEADASADIDAAAEAWPPYQSAMSSLEALPAQERDAGRAYYQGLARSLARNAMGRVGEADALSIAAAADLAALGLPVWRDMTGAVIERMAEIGFDLEARRQRDLSETAEAHTALDAP
jgi:hypothetical protein